MRRNLMKFVAVAGVILAAAACTPTEVAMYKSLSPEDQVKVVAAIQEQQRQETQFYLGVLAAQQSESIQMNPFLTCVRHHESDRGPFPHTAGYQAENPYSSASGAYQFIDSTWRSVSAAAGYPGYGHASWAPPSVQDRVAYHVAIELGQRYHWNGTGC